MADLVLEKMTARHVSDVLAIERRVFATPWSEEMFLHEVRGSFGSRAVVAKLTGRLVGYAIAWFIDDEVHLVNIAVDLPYQALGVGSTLLIDLIDEALASDKRIITLEVRESNVEAQGFYRGFFFQTIGVRKNYYSDNREDALLMVLDLRRFARRGKTGDGGA